MKTFFYMFFIEFAFPYSLLNELHNWIPKRGKNSSVVAALNKIKELQSAFLKLWTKLTSGYDLKDLQNKLGTESSCINLATRGTKYSFNLCLSCHKSQLIDG